MHPTDLVNECYLRLASNEKYREMRRPEFLAVAATVIRRLLVDESRRTQRSAYRTVSAASLAEVAASAEAPALDLLALDDGLRRLAQRDERQSRIVELRFFSGLSGDEVANLLGISRRTVNKEWKMARAWLQRELSR